MSGRRLAHRSIKGPIFPSYVTEKESKPKFEYNAHSSVRAQTRNLRNKCRHLIDSKDPEVIAVGLQVINAVINEPDPEFGSLHLMAAGLDASEERGIPWTQAMMELLDEFNKREQPPERNEEECLPSPSLSNRLTRFLKRLVGITSREKESTT